MTPKELQYALIANGYDLPKYGPDGFYGNETEDALERWFGDGTPLIMPGGVGGEPLPPPTTNPIVPAVWMPPANMSRIIVHWTGGGHKANRVDKAHYHIIVEGDGNLVRGNHSIRDNESANGGYAAHTRGLNSRSIGISAAAMLGAREVPFDPGPQPLRPEQWDTLAQVAAELCMEYNILVTTKTVLQHGEVQGNLGIWQRQKWDINRLPFDPEVPASAVHRQFRVKVNAHLTRLRGE